MPIYGECSRHLMCIIGLVIVSTLQGKYGYGGWSDLHRSTDPAPPCSSFCLVLFTILPSSLKREPDIYWGLPCLPIKKNTLSVSFMCMMVTFIPHSTLSSRSSNSCSLPSYPQPIALLLHVFFLVQVLCREPWFSVFMVVTAWPFLEHSIS